MEKKKSIFRELTYQEKSRNEDFGIDNKGSVDQILYDEYLLTRVNLNPGKPLFYQRIVELFNDAHFVCTLILSYPNFKYNLSYFISTVSMPSVVMPMVHFYLSKVSRRTHHIDRFLIIIETEVKGNEDWQLNYNYIKVLEDKYQITIEPSYFPRQELNPEFLSTIQWWSATDRFNINSIKNIIRYIAKDKLEVCMIADAIKDAAEEYDFNIRPEWYFDDEQGCDVEYIPKSLKSQGVYDLCDEIKENYDTFWSKRKALLRDEQECAEDSQTSKSIVITEPSTGDEDNTIFVENLNVSVIAKEIRTLSGYDPKNRIFAKTVHEAFKALGLLSDYTLTKFVAWGRKQKVFTFTSELKGIHVSSDMKRKIDEYKTRFTDEQSDEDTLKSKFKKKDKCQNPLIVKLNK